MIGLPPNGKAEPQRRVGETATLAKYTNKVKRRDVTSAEDAVGSSGCWAAQRLEVAQTLLAHWFERYDEMVCPPSLLSGGDLMAELGLESGPEIGRLLWTLQEAQVAGEVRTRDEALALLRDLGG